MQRFLGLFLVFYYLFSTGKTASTLEELKNNYMSIAMKCKKDYPLTQDDVMAMQKKIVPDNPTVKCFIACAYKETGMMDDKGFLSVEGVRKISEKYISEDPDILNKSNQFTDACKSVNEIPVSDGDKGCERAALIYKCTVEKAPNFGFGV